MTELSTEKPETLVELNIEKQDIFQKMMYYKKYLVN
jgi:hypothetical protein